MALTKDGRVYTWGLHPNLLRYAMGQARRARAGGHKLTEQPEQCTLTVVDTQHVNSEIIKVNN